MVGLMKKLLKEAEDLKIREASSGNTGLARRIACVFALDISGSMVANDNIGKLNKGLREFKDQVMASDVKNLLDVAVISFGGDAKIVQGFTPLATWNPPTLIATGGTPMLSALNMAMNILYDKHEEYKKENTISGVRWIFCITDGDPGERDAKIESRLRSLEREKKLRAICIGTPGFDQRAMKEIYDINQIYQLENLNYAALFGFFKDMIVAEVDDEIAGTTTEVKPPTDVMSIAWRG